MKTKLFLTTLVLTTATTLLVAQDKRPQQGSRPPGNRPQGSQQGGPGSSQGGQNGGPGMQGGQRPSFPLIDALDVNKDHIIDAAEMANAVAALKKLDKNGDGKLTPDEYLPKRPGGQGGPGGQ